MKAVVERQTRILTELVHVHNALGDAGYDRVNHRAASRFRVDGKLAADDFQPLLHTGQAEAGPSHRLVRIKAGARILDCQGDVVGVPVQRDVGVSVTRHV